MVKEKIEKGKYEIIRKYRKPLEEFDLTNTRYLVMIVLWEFGVTKGYDWKRER